MFKKSIFKIEFGAAHQTGKPQKWLDLTSEVEVRTLFNYHQSENP